MMMMMMMVVVVVMMMMRLMVHLFLSLQLLRLSLRPFLLDSSVNLCALLHVPHILHLRRRLGSGDDEDDDYVPASLAPLSPVLLLLFLREEGHESSMEFEYE